MALPSVMQAKLDALEALEPEQGTPIITTTEQSNSPVLVVENVVLPEILNTENSDPVVPAADETEWQKEVKELRKKYLSLQGMHKGYLTDIENSDRELAELKASFECLKASIPPKIPEVDVSEQITDEERAVYEAAFPVIEKINKRTNRQLVETVIEPLKKKIAELESSQGKISKGLEDTSGDAFYAAVSSRIPNFENTIESSGWQDYLQEKAPYSKHTVGQLLDAAHKAKDFDGVSEIFSRFDGPQQKTVPNKVSSINSMTSPSLSSANGSSGVREKPSAKWSDYEKAHREFIHGKITKKQMDEVDVYFNQAESENRIVYDVPQRRSFK